MRPGTLLLGTRVWLLVGVALVFSALGNSQSTAQGIPERGASAPAFSACPDSATQPETVETPCLGIVVFAEGTESLQRAGIVRGAGAAMRFSFEVVNGAAVLVPNAGAYSALAFHPSVARLIPDRPVQALKGPPGGCDPWPECKNAEEEEDTGGSGGDVIPAGVWRIGADLVWGSYKGAGVNVAIADTGLDTDHPDLAANIAGGVTCRGDEENATCVADGGEDDHGHGTHVGGIVAADDNGADVVGVAPDAMLYSVKVLDSSGSGWDSNVIAGLEWVGTQPIQVVNMSLGREGNCLNTDEDGDGNPDDPSADLVRQAIQALTGNGVSVVVAAGNDRDKEVKDMVPAGCPEVMAIASTTAEDGTNKCKMLPGDILADTASFFTTDGAMAQNGVGVTISAPGETREDNSCGVIQSVGIESTAMGGGTTEKSGTSMASPHVAGVVALVLEAQGPLCPEGVRDILRTTADRVGAVPLDHPYISESLDGELEGVVYAPDAVTGGTSACN